MVFCSVEMAARIERAECQLLVDACQNVARRLGSILATPIAGGFAAFTEPDSPLNKVTGLGFAGAFDEAAWVAIEAAHAERQAPVQVELATLAEPGIARLLTQRGFELVSVENVLGRSLPIEGSDQTFPDLRITQATAVEHELWLELLITGFAAPDVQGVPTTESYDRSVLERVMRDFAEANGVVRYLAYRQGEPAGAATMRMHDGVAQLCGAATLPAHRRCGVQSALLAHRLAEAGRHGCTIATVTTQPGSKSQANVQRQGFDLLYARNVLRREPR